MYVRECFCLRQPRVCFLRWGRLIMLCVLPVVQFCTQAFNTYARLTDADVLFSSTMKYLKFFRYFWQYNAFLFVILIIVLLSGIYFVRPHMHFNPLWHAVQSCSCACAHPASVVACHCGGLCWSMRCCCYCC